MWRICLMIFFVAIVSCAKAQISVQGEISGLFLTSKGQLVWRTISGDEPVSDLQPFWGHYRLTLTVRSHSAPIKSIEVANSHGQKIWHQNFEPPKTDCRIPAYPPSALQIHASDGFRFRLSVAFADGSKLEREWKAPIDRPVHPFRIDWLSLAAMTEALRLLRVYGREIFPQSPKIPIAWCFHGENGQLFVNHPNPPKGSRQVNLTLLPNVLAFWLPEKQRPFFEPGAFKGATALIGGRQTCSIYYTPIWSNRDPSSFMVDIFNATFWVYIALHEALHAVSLSTFNVRNEQVAVKVLKFMPPDKWIDWLVTQWMEREALRQAINAAENAKEVEETKETREAVEKGFLKVTPPPASWSKSKEKWQQMSQKWIWAFLQFRERRRALLGSNRLWLKRSEQIIEWAENIAHWGAVWLIGKAERESMSPLLSADPTAASYPDDEFENWADESAEIDPNELELELFGSYGLGKLLSYWDENWLQKAAKGRMLEDLLAEVTGYTSASEKERSAAIDEVASEVIASAAKVRQELQKFFTPNEGKPCLSVSGKLPKFLKLEWSENGEMAGELKAIALKWDDGSLLKIVRNGKLAFKGHDQVAVYAPVNEAFKVTRHRNQFSVQIGEFVSFKWLPESKALSVKVLGEQWIFRNGKTKPNWLPPEGWTAIKVGQSWLWLKAAVRGGLQFMLEGGKRWDEAPMATLPYPVAFSPNHALTTEAPSDLIFTVRTVDKSLRIRSLTVNLRSINEDGEVTAQKASPKGEHELRLVLPFKLHWQIEHKEDGTRNLIWFARFNEKEIRWLLGVVVAEVNVELTNNKTVETSFLSGVFHPLLLAVEVKAQQEMTGELMKPTFSPAIGARCRVYFYRQGAFDPTNAQCIAEKFTDETGKTLFLIHAFYPEKVGLTTSVLVEHERMRCQRLEGLALWPFKDHAILGSILSVNSLLAPHEVTFTLEIEATRHLYRAEIRDKEWLRFKEREEPVTKVRVIVERKKSIDSPSQVIFDGEVEGRLTLTVPTLGHDLSFSRESLENFEHLVIKIVDPVTAKERRLNLSISAHGLYYYEREKMIQLVGKDNPP
ncbi:MAG: hypothetical protein NZ805_14890, partial [Armatimonadetes bacterium]|nr:hypothetical protein [Armatimonadota bacterium]